MYKKNNDHMKRKNQLEHLRRTYGTSEERSKRKALSESGRGLDKSKGGRES